MRINVGSGLLIGSPLESTISIRMCMRVYGRRGNFEGEERGIPERGMLRNVRDWNFIFSYSFSFGS